MIPISLRGFRRTALQYQLKFAFSGASYDRRKHQENKDNNVCYWLGGGRGHTHTQKKPHMWIQNYTYEYLL